MTGERRSLDGSSLEVTVRLAESETVDKTALLSVVRDGLVTGLSGYDSECVVGKIKAKQDSMDLPKVQPEFTYTFHFDTLSFSGELVLKHEIEQSILHGISERLVESNFDATSHEVDLYNY